MRTISLLLSLIILQLLTVGIVRAQDDLLNKSQSLFKPIPETPPELENNQITSEKVELGKMLYLTCPPIISP